MWRGLGADRDDDDAAIAAEPGAERRHAAGIQEIVFSGQFSVLSPLLPVNRSPFAGTEALCSPSHPLPVNLSVDFILRAAVRVGCWCA